jgi:hypothetical protein
MLQLANMNSIQSVLMTNADSSGFYEQEEVRQRESRQKFLQQNFTKLRHSATELKQKATLWYLSCFNLYRHNISRNNSLFLNRSLAWWVGGCVQQEGDDAQRRPRK